MALSGRKTSAALRTGCGTLSAVKEISKLCKIFDIAHFISYIANFWPMQARGPTENVNLEIRVKYTEENTLNSPALNGK